MSREQINGPGVAHDLCGFYPVPTYLTESCRLSRVLASKARGEIIGGAKTTGKEVLLDQ